MDNLLTVHRAPLLLALIAACSCAGGDQEAAEQSNPEEDNAPVVANVGPGRWAESGVQAWSLAERVRIGSVEGNGPDVFGRVRNVRVDSEGHIWVFDWQSFELRKFDTDGTHLASIGGPGQGPGEFSENACLIDSPPDEMWVEDAGRYQRFNLDGELVGSQTATRRMSCALTQLREDRYLAFNAFFDRASDSFTGAILIHDIGPDGSLILRDTVPDPGLEGPEEFHWMVDGRERGTVIPLQHLPAVSVGPTGTIWITKGRGDYRLTRISLDGQPELHIEREFTPVAIPDDIRDAAIQGLNREGLGWPDDFDEGRIPRTYAPFDRVFEATDGHVWVRRVTAGGGRGFDVFNPDGSFLGHVPLPDELRSLSPSRISEREIHGVVRDDLDVQYVVRLQIVKP